MSTMLSSTTESSLSDSENERKDEVLVGVGGEKSRQKCNLLTYGKTNTMEMLKMYVC